MMKIVKSEVDGSYTATHSPTQFARYTVTGHKTRIAAMNALYRLIMGRRE